MKGVEPAPSETDLSFIGKNSEGMEVYEMTVTSTTGNSFDVVPYTAGADAANIKLYADEYTPKALAASVLESPVTVYADVDGTDDSAVNFVALVGSDAKVLNAKSGNYVAGTTGNFSFNNTGTTCTRGYSSGMRLTYYNRNTYYWRGTDTNAAGMSTSTTNADRNRWTVYPVTIVAPTVH